MNVVIFCSDTPTSPELHIFSFCRTLLQAGLSIYIERSLSDRLSENGLDCESLLPFDELPEDTDVVVSIGGDGTFLRSARRIGFADIPIIGVNAGHLGFLTQYSLNEGEELASDLLSGNMETENRMLLELRGESLPEDLWPYALNEVAVLKEDTASMIEVAIYDNRDFIADCQADGVIVSTPGGSTAYSLSAGGPIVAPSMEAFGLVPVAPHTLTLRPMIMPAESEIRLHPLSRTGRCRVGLDGCSFPLPTPCELYVRRAPFALKVLKRPGESFYSVLRKKLHWSRR